ncbi:DUF4012 domain-containing protein [Cryobacterium lactosi]|uniref:DUF4012 domain-containing protein n=1 Tax=Cryobacterium lactosi TaxID=1259202 RepID=A0A4R9BGA7_9MICO|nr:DUF4012 domain-containing protein [Cryobacterium lactosi]TFD83898.1 DUF4012 domain-containing protein [Cryobacterium lactosi]
MLVLLAVVIVLLGSVAWVGVRAVLARGELEGAIPLASTMQRQVVDGDGDGARLTGEELTQRAASAAALTSDPVWRAFEGIPALGPNLAVVRQLAAVVDDLAKNGIAPLAEVAGGISVNDFRPVDGAIDVQPLIDAQPAISSAATAIVAAQTQASALDTNGTLDEVSGAAGRLSAAVDEAAVSISAVDRAVRIIPAMLGANGPRNYAVLFQNPAELRSTGGIVGAVALIHTENGAIQLTQQAPGASFPRHAESVLDLPPDTGNLYSQRTGQYMLNVGLTPSFPLSAKLAQEMWRLEYGVQVDGVLSIDPVALGYILAATGPITLPTGDVLSSENAVSLLLTDVYARYAEPSDQDAFFAAAAASVFSAVAGGDVDPVKLITALGKAGAEHRVLVWSSSEGEQAILADTSLAGSLPISDDATQRFGLYLNDATGAKMGTYLDVNSSIGQVTCRNDRRPNYTVEVTLTNTAPADAATVLPRYVTGGGVFGVAPGNVKTIVSVYAAPDMQNLGLSQDGQPVPYLPASDDGYQVSAIAIELSPGQSTVLRYNWLGPQQFAGENELQMTPVIHRNETKKLDIGC